MAVSPYMTIQECAEYIRLTPKTIYKKAHYKEIPSRKHGSRLLFHKDEIDAWSAARARPAERGEKISKFKEARARLRASGRKSS